MEPTKQESTTETQSSKGGVISGFLFPSNDEIEKAVKDLAKQSTAPDKETPDWMENDIRRGIMWALQRIEIGNNTKSTCKHPREFHRGGEDVTFCGLCDDVVY
jgi:pimeloyl-CoA synthetase